MRLYGYNKACFGIPLVRGILQSFLLKPGLIKQPIKVSQLSYAQTQYNLATHSKIDYDHKLPSIPHDPDWHRASEQHRAG